MKKFITLFIIAVFCVALYGCSNDNKTTAENEINTNANEIDGYQYADFKTYNSYAEDNGLKDTPVYIKGVVKGVYEFEHVCMISVEADDGGMWDVIFLMVFYSDEMEKLFNEKPIVCFGNYRGYSDMVQKPVIVAEKVEVGKKTYTVEDLIEYNKFISTEPTTEKTTESE